MIEKLMAKTGNAIQYMRTVNNISKDEKNTCNRKNIGRKLLALLLIFFITISPMGNLRRYVLAVQEEIPDGYTEIRTIQELQNINNNPAGSYILMNDIDLAGYNWYPLAEFSGVFDGNGHKIKNMTIKGNADDYNCNGYGLFSAISGGSVQYLGMVDVDIELEDGTDYLVGSVGGLAGTVGRNKNGGFNAYIRESYVTGNISCESGECGGIIGSVPNIYQLYLAILDSYTCCDIRVNGKNGVAGGLVGYIQFGEKGYQTIERSYAAGQCAADRTGGICYTTAYDKITIENCYYHDGKNYDQLKGTSLTEEQMKRQDTYENYVFYETWIMGRDTDYLYPMLRNNMQESGRRKISEASFTPKEEYPFYVYRGAPIQPAQPSAVSWSTQKEQLIENYEEVFHTQTWLNGEKSTVYGGKKLVYTAKWNDGESLIENVDYVIDYGKNNAEGMAEVVIRGILNYRGEIAFPFQIRKCEISTVTVKMNYNDNGEKLVIDYQDGKPVMWKLYNDKEQYITQLEEEYATYIYDGVPVCPSVTVEWEGEQLINGVDYTVDYQDNDDKGTATLTIRGGEFSKGGEISIPFNIIKRDNLIKVKYGENRRINVCSEELRTTLGASDIEGAMTYISDTPEVKVNNNGKVTITPGYSGSAVITMTAPETKLYNETIKKVNIIMTSAGDGEKNYRVTLCSRSNRKITVHRYAEGGNIQASDTGYNGRGWYYVNNNNSVQEWDFSNSVLTEDIVLAEKWSSESRKSDMKDKDGARILLVGESYEQYYQKGSNLYGNFKRANWQPLNNGSGILKYGAPMNGWSDSTSCGVTGLKPGIASLQVTVETNSISGGTELIAADTQTFSYRVVSKLKSFFIDSQLNLEFGQITSLNLSINPQESYVEEAAGLTYSSSNNKVAVVYEDGSIYAVGEGTAVITVAADSRYSDADKKTCVVTVNSKTEDIKDDKDTDDSQNDEDENDQNKDRILVGDVNGDGAIDIKDSVLLKRYLAGWNEDINLSTADVDGSAEVNIRDCVLLNRYLAGWDVVLMPVQDDPVEKEGWKKCSGTGYYLYADEKQWICHENLTSGQVWLSAVGSTGDLYVETIDSDDEELELEIVNLDNCKDKYTELAWEGFDIISSEKMNMNGVEGYYSVFGQDGAKRWSEWLTLMEHKIYVFSFSTFNDEDFEKLESDVIEVLHTIQFTGASE